MTTPPRPRGRRPATNHATIEREAFRLFEERGYEDTTVEAIADAVGIGRRTLFRYFPSKNDIPWGQFDESLERFGHRLATMPHELPVYEAVHQAVLEFNHVDAEAIVQHRQRMSLLLHTPALRAHSALKHAAWRSVIASYVAERYGLSEDDLLPQTIGRVSLALALSAYERWVETEDRPLTELLDEAMVGLRGFLGDGDRPAHSEPLRPA